MRRSLGVSEGRLGNLIPSLLLNHSFQSFASLGFTFACKLAVILLLHGDHYGHNRVRWALTGVRSTNRHGNPAKCSLILQL